MSILVWVLFGQLAVGGLILLVLAHMLNTMLSDMAVRYIELWHPNEDEDEPAVRSVHVISHRALKSVYHERIKRAVSRNFPADIQMNFSQDPKILGGVIIRMDARVMDCSLRDRIQKAFGSSN